MGPGDKPFADAAWVTLSPMSRRQPLAAIAAPAFSKLVAGSLLSRPRDEYTCSMTRSAATSACRSSSARISSMRWRRPRGLEVGATRRCPSDGAGQLARPAADGNSDIGLDEVGRFLRAASSKSSPGRAASGAAHAAIAAARSRQHLDRREVQPRSLEQAARQAGPELPFPAAVFERARVTPHQYLVRSRLRHRRACSRPTTSRSPTRL